MAYTVTYLQMTAPGRLEAAPRVPGLRLGALPPASPLIPELLARIGAAYGWKSSRRSAAQWRTWLTENPSRSYALLAFEGEPAGIVVYDGHPGDEVEIKSFGLLPELIGKGLGGAALTLGIERAWALEPGTTRVWLHTSSKDHPRALPNYLRRGFSVFAIEEHDEA